MPEQTPPPNLEEQFVAESIPIGLPWRLLVFSLVLFGLSVSVYFGLKFGYSSYLKAETESIDNKIDNLAKEVSQEDQQNFVNFYSQLINLKRVLDQHEFSSNLFGFLERNTIQTVYYNDASFSSDNRTMLLKGEAESSEVLVQQLNVFEKTPELEKVILDQMVFDSAKRNVGFSVALIFRQNFFSQPRQ